MFNPFFRQDKDYFVENLAMLLDSGLSISPALLAIKEEMRSAKMQKIIAELLTEVEGGSALWRALAKSQLFAANVTSLIRVGEESGRLSENLKVITTQQQKERVFRSKLRSAMMYPVFVLGLAFVLGVGIVWFLLPRLAAVFVGLKVELPLITRWLIALGEFIRVYGALVIPLSLLAFAFLLYGLFFFPKTKYLGQYLFFYLPGVNKLIQGVELARFGYVLGSLLEAGLPIVEAFESLQNVSPLLYYQKFYSFLKEKVEEGNSLQKSFLSYSGSRHLLPAAVRQMIIAGEQSGKLPATLLKVGEIFETKTDITTKNLTVILEPILLLIVWLAVLAIALAVILPIYSLLGGLQQ